ncbi:hypothetical protein O9G_001369 [Rozella allomycis CSF55]|uniref:Uncharacterized protein n=1 Tax=Rozella allomycis (strain CSF55) TaxID=988480 RepID=A0A075AUS4_ROZAC|nr:hypothetical protein O9G_001369 [Rozella allomycis CSF55]|eukprot:EPZ32467.1 hypothetical protein O9G_001369 [Rozella allomycis CSF55]
MAKKELGEVEKYLKKTESAQNRNWKKVSRNRQDHQFEGRLDPSGRMKKKTLMDKFNQVRASRAASGLPPIEMPEFDYERLMTEIKRENKAIQRGEKVDDGLDEYLDDELPPLPLGIPPPHELISYLVMQKCFPGDKMKIDSDHPALHMPDFLEPGVATQRAQNATIESAPQPVHNKEIPYAKENDNEDGEPVQTNGLLGIADYGSDSEAEVQEEKTAVVDPVVNTEIENVLKPKTIDEILAYAPSVISAEPEMRDLQADLQSASRQGVPGILRVAIEHDYKNLKTA